MKGILVEIIENKRIEVERAKKDIPIEYIKDQALSMPPVRDFAAALRRNQGPLKLLAEIKTASPSAGSIRQEVDAAEVAHQFECYGASAISVLTDYKYFSGTIEQMTGARQATTVPVLRKDFTIDEYQLYESRLHGADAVLLMAQVLKKDQYKELLQKAYDIGLQVLAEGHTAEQIEMLVEIGAPVIGINNRDFETMTIDLNTTLNNCKLIPDDRVVVSQSGMFTRADVEPIDACGVDAIQVGTSIMKHDNIQQQIDLLLGK